MQCISRLQKSFIFWDISSLTTVKHIFSWKSRRLLLVCIPPKVWEGGRQKFSIVQNLLLEQGWPHVAIMIILLNSVDFTVCKIQVTSLFLIWRFNKSDVWTSYNWKFQIASAGLFKTSDITVTYIKWVHACQDYARKHKSTVYSARTGGIPSRMPMSRVERLKNPKGQSTQVHYASFVCPKQTKVTTRCHQPFVRTPCMHNINSQLKKVGEKEEI